LFTKIVAREALGILLLCSVASAQAPDAQPLLNSPKFRSAQDFVDKDHDRIVRETIQITEIEAPPFKEEKRAKAFAELLRQSGLKDVTIDAEGNVIGIRKGTGLGPLVAIPAHLDTVFPEGTNVKVRREGTRLFAPGVGDDSRGLAVLLAIIRALDAAKIQTASDILFVGNVGEEGPGDLRGMKYLFERSPYKDKIKMFVSLDPAGPGTEIMNGAVGSKRYKITFSGPGGHSYAGFGLVNPVFAMGNAITKISKMQVPSNPRTTYNVGVIGGGTSVNSIPFEAWMEVDLRSEPREELNKQADILSALIRQAVEEENRARSTGQGKVEVDIKIIGDRPSGATPINAPIVQSAAAVIRAFGSNPAYGMSSTDSNIPISMGIPAIPLESGATGGRNHSLDEWVDMEKTQSVRGINIAMGVLLALAGIQ